MTILPNRSIVQLTSALTCSGDVTSVGTANASPPSNRICCASCSRGTAERATRTTAAAPPGELQGNALAEPFGGAGDQHDLGSLPLVCAAVRVTAGCGCVARAAAGESVRPTAANVCSCSRPRHWLGGHGTGIHRVLAPGDRDGSEPSGDAAWGGAVRAGERAASEVCSVR